MRKLYTQIYTIRIKVWLWNSLCEDVMSRWWRRRGEMKNLWNQSDAIDRLMRTARERSEIKRERWMKIGSFLCEKQLRLCSGRTKSYIYLQAAITTSRHWLLCTYIYTYISSIIYQLLWSKVKRGKFKLYRNDLQTLLRFILLAFTRLLSAHS